MTHSNRRFIEESFPVKEVSQHAAKEKNIRHGHISTLHIWWARRPLAASRATAYAALTPAAEDILEWQKQRNFIVDLCQWENSLNAPLLERARRAIYAAHAERLSAELGRPVSVDDIEAGRVPPPRVLDPFSGGGSYPLEALRLGCDAYANDYNPVAVLILKATLEYPQRYGTRIFTDATGEHEWLKNIRANPSNPRSSVSHSGQSALFELAARPANPLLEAVKYWGEWVLNEARRELEGFYSTRTDTDATDEHGRLKNIRANPSNPRPSVSHSETVVGYIWARTLPCQNPACGVEIPLMRQFWLAKKNKKKVALWLDSTRMDTGTTDEHGFSQNKNIRANPSNPRTSVSHLTFRIVGDGYDPWPAGFDPERGTVKGAVVTCPACGAVIDAATTRRLFREGKAGQRMVAVVTAPAKGRGEGKTYRLPTEADLAAYRAAQAALQARCEHLRAAWGMEPLPDEPLPIGGRDKYDTCRLPLYGINTWGELFNPRQALALLTFADAVRRAHAGMLAQGYPEDFARAVATYLAITVDNLAEKDNSLSRWANTKETVAGSFGRQALPMLWDYVEINPLSDSTGGWTGATEYNLRIIDHLTHIPAVPGGERTRIGANATDEHGAIRANPSNPCKSVSHSSATRLPYPDGFFDAVLTDPPYYDNVPYSDLSDFFYVWLKRTIGHLYSDLFITPLTPKAGEIVADAIRQNGTDSARQFFEKNLALAFREMYRVLKPGGVATVVYAHKSTAGWETVINALLDSGLVVSAAWPLNTEMGSRLNANETASLASSIYIVARKAPRQGLGFYHEVRAELRRHMDERLQRLWEEGIGGADFFIAAIGSAIEVVGKYEQVMDLEGNVIRGDVLLDEVRALATDFAVRQILHEGGQAARPYSAEISDRARFYVLWRWNYGEARVPFDEARKLAQSCGLDLVEEWSRRGGVVKKEKEFVRLLGPQQREMEHLAAGRELIDILHHALRLWEKGDRVALIARLSESGYGRSEAFYRVAQAISECLPIESKEKKLLDGLLTGRTRLQEEVGQARLL